MALVKILKHASRTGLSFECQVFFIAADGTVTQLDHVDGIFRSVAATPKIPLVETPAGSGLFIRPESRSAWSDGNHVMIPNEVGKTAPDGGCEFEMLDDVEVLRGPIKSLITTISNRIGAWTGTGINTILGAFKALLSKIAAMPSDIGGTPDPATDSVEALSERLNAVGGLTGIHTATLQFYRTATTTPIPDVSADIYDSTETTHLNGTQLQSDVNGQVSFGRNNGTYKVRAMLAGFTFTTGTLVVNDANVTLIMYGAAAAADAPIPVGAIRVYDYCFGADGITPMPTADVSGKMRIIELPYNYNGRLHSGKSVTGTYNVGTGKIYWDIAPGAHCSWNIKHLMTEDIEKHVPMTAVGNEIRLEDIPS